MNPNQPQQMQGQQGGGVQNPQQPFPYPGNQAGNGVQQGQNGQMGQDPANRPGQPQGIVSPMQQAGSLQNVLQGIGQFLARINHPLSAAFNGLHGFGPQGTPAMNAIQNPGGGVGQAVNTMTQPTGSQTPQGQNLGAGAGSAITSAIGGIGGGMGGNQYK